MFRLHRLNDDVIIWTCKAYIVTLYCVTGLRNFTLDAHTTSLLIIYGKSHCMETSLQHKNIPTISSYIRIG